MAKSPATSGAPVAAMTELAALMQAAVDAIIVIETSGKVVAFSRSAELMFGYSCEEILGRPVSDLMPEPYRSSHSRYVENYRNTGQPHIIGIGREVKAKRKDGSVFPVWLSVGETKSEDGHRFVGIIRDLTDQQAAETERRTLETRLEHVSRLSLLGEMAAGIAHEINQPLTAITNYSQVAKNVLESGAADPATLAAACTGISEQVQRAADVIKNLRKLVRNREVEKTEIDLVQLVENVMGLINADTAHEGVAVETIFENDLPSILGNSVQLQQVLLNLTRNAVDAMRDNVRRRKELAIEIVGPSAGCVEIRVSDRGPGVASSLVDAIFNPFFTTKHQGIGVGLAISRSIVESHGGELRYEERDGGGSTFIIELPILER